MIRITLRYFDGCPNWETTDRRLAILIEEDWDATIEYDLIDCDEVAVERDFGGSPTVLVDGVDPFPGGSTQPGLACRMYDTDMGAAGSPTIDQLREVIARAEKGKTHGDGD